jgi:cytochrome c peroxidase
VFLEAGCAGCHDPERTYTDGRAHVLGGLRGDEAVRAFDTPSLHNVRYTAPYFHDGRYETLDAMLADGANRMGDLRGVGPDDRRALVRFLETL